MNVRHLLGCGDPRCLALGRRRAPLKPENLFYVGARSYEPEERAFIRQNNIFFGAPPPNRDTPSSVINHPSSILERIGGKKYIISFDFDVLDRRVFDALQVPEAGGPALPEIMALLSELITPNMLAAEFVEYAPTLASLPGHQEIVKTIINLFLNKCADFS